MARPNIFPHPFPHEFQEKPGSAGEHLLYDILLEGLDESWTVFYDWSVKGTKKRLDFLCVSPDQGLAAFEVKDSEVHVKGDKFLQLNRKTMQRHRIDPFKQIKSGFSNVIAKCNLDPTRLPNCHFACFFPVMRQSGLGFAETPHFFTLDNMTSASAFCLKLLASLSPPHGQQGAELENLIQAMQSQKQGPKRIRDPFQ